MMKNGPFCNSDKYSFLLAFEQVISQLPENIRQLLDRGEGTFTEMAPEETRTPAYIRRLYLQDLYRLFRIFSQRNAFRSIFDLEERNYLFFSSPLFFGTPLEAHFNEVTAFLLKKKRIGDAKTMLRCYDVSRRDFQYYMMSGYIGENPRMNYAKALELEPENERALAGYARALFANTLYEEALEMYEKLLQLQPDKKLYLLNKAVCLTNMSRYDEAERLLFRLNYELEDDENVNRVLAWALTCDGKYERAERLYHQLLSVEKPAADDLLNYGYCLWFGGHIDEAADCFHRYMMESNASKEWIFGGEERLMREKGITEVEQQMMLYIL
jgi:tetratricopeptide (TPR) repeat protein